MNELHLKTRREFLRTGALGAATAWTMPAFLSRTVSTLGAEEKKRTGKDDTILVVIQLAGGNDGLNTVVPHTNDHYHKARPTLALKDKLLKLDDSFSFHPAFEPMKELFDAGELAIIHGVGYPNPNRSHFRSTEIWHTASDAKKFERHGWLGRYFDSACKGADPAVGVALGRQMPQAFSGPKPMGISLDNPESYRLAGTDTPDADETASSVDFMRKLNTPQGMDAEAGTSIESLTGPISSDLSPLDFLERTALDAQLSSDKILGISRRASNSASYPASQFANSLKLIARLIAGGMATRVYYASQGGYDTHTNQASAHERLLRDFSGALKAFRDDLKAQGNFNRVLVMTFSEFGRRVSQNANGGTDHGAAAPLFMLGGKVKPGFLGRFPSLAPADLLNGDPRFTTDFRSVYAGVLEHWLQAKSQPVLKGDFKPLALL